MTTYAHRLLHRCMLEACKFYAFSGTLNLFVTGSPVLLMITQLIEWCAWSILRAVLFYFRFF